MKSKVTTRRKKLSFPRAVEVRVGVLDGDQRYEGEEQSPAVRAFAPSLATPTVGEIAEQHEFGLGVPERSWLRSWFDEREGELRATALDAFQRNAEDPARGARLLAVLLEASIKNRITQDKPFVELAPETIAERQSRGRTPPWTPLVDTGLFLSSIKATSEVKP